MGDGQRGGHGVGQYCTSMSDSMISASHCILS
jgi:hypothetical protein